MAATTTGSSGGWSNCELSGEPLVRLSSSLEDEDGGIVVVTPSGHVCLRRFLLLKWKENGGVDPFTGAALSLDDCIALKLPSAPAAVLAPPSATLSSFTQLLQHMQREYDAVVLELFDTRQLLQSTRKELSQALYQQDAALRVVARLLKEAEEQKRTGKVSGAPGVNDSTTGSTVASKKRARIDDEEDRASVDAKTVKTASDTMTATEFDRMIELPTDDIDAMFQAWHRLSQSRKSLVQQYAPQQAAVAAAAAAAASSSTPLFSLVQPSVPNTHNHPFVSVLAAKAWEQYQVVVGTTLSSVGMMVWKSQEDMPQQQQALVELPKYKGSSEAFIPSSLLMFDMQPPHVVVVAAATTEHYFFALYDLNIETWATTTFTADHDIKNRLIQVQLHPATQHVVFTYDTGLVTLQRFSVKQQENFLTLTRVASWQPFVVDDNDITPRSAPSSAVTAVGVLSSLHPDGLLHAICKSRPGSQRATQEGLVVYLWNLKEQSLATSFALPTDPTTSSTVTALCFSPNGYHMGMAVCQEDSSKILIWDLRKSKIVSSLAVSSPSSLSEDNNSNTSPIAQLTFDLSGKSLAYALVNGSVGMTNFKSKTALNEPLVVLQAQAVASQSTPSSLLWPLPHRIVATYRNDDKDKNEPARVICVLEAKTTTTTSDRDLNDRTGPTN